MSSRSLAFAIAAGSAVLAVAAGAAAAVTLEDRYKDAARKIIAAATSGNAAFEELAYLCDHFPGRLAGSKNLESAIAWSAAQMKRDGLANVSTPLVKVPHWERGEESAEIVAPLARPLHMMGLGLSVGTPPEGITAPVVPVASFDELAKLGRDKVAGKIVLFNVPFTGYGPTVAYRGAGASRAAALGAVAMLLRSVTPLSLQSPHTGMLDYSADAPKIPAAAISIEDALLLQRLSDAGESPSVHLKMSARTLPDADSANVIGEIVGSEKPEEIVVIGGHIDSWDVAPGAQDDGSGCIASLQAAVAILKAGLHPRRTLRVVFWTNEENGGAGGRGYREWVGDQVHRHVAAIEMDGGAEKPVGFGITWLDPNASAPAGPQRSRRGGPRPAEDPRSGPALARLREIGPLLQPIEASDITAGGGGADIGPIMMAGVPGLALRTVGTHYFDWHHTAADTPDKIKPEDLRASVAAMAVMAYILADMPDNLMAEHLPTR